MIAVVTEHVLPQLENAIAPKSITQQPIALIYILVAQGLVTWDTVIFALENAFAIWSGPIHQILPSVTSTSVLPTAMAMEFVTMELVNATLAGLGKHVQFRM